MRKKIKVLLSLILSIAVLAGGMVMSFLWWKKQPPKSEPIFDPVFLSQNEQKADYARLHTLLGQADPVQWLFAGDSITHGCQHTAYLRNFSELFQQYIQTVPLEGVVRSRDLVMNTGVSSATTDTMNQYFAPWLVQPNPDVVFLCLGMNDCTAENMTVAQYKAHLNNAIDWMQANQVIPILQTPNRSSRNREIEPYLEAVRTIAVEREILLVDFNLFWKQHQKELTKMMSDKIHPNAAGHLTWCRFLLRSLGMMEEESRLAQLSYDTDTEMTQHKLSLPIPQANQDARGKLEPALGDDVPVVWVFLGGKSTQGFTASLRQRNYMEHFQEVARWETQMESFTGRCKLFINGGADGITIGDLMDHYEELAGQFQPDVVCIMPDITNSAGNQTEQDVSAAVQNLLRLVQQAQATGAAVLLQTPFALGDDAQALRIAVIEVAEQTGAAYVDQTALLDETLAKNPELASILFDDKGNVTAEGHYWIGRNLAFQLTDPPANSRMR